MRIALGPLLYFWPREQVLDFYAGVARLPVDVVYLGETVCAKRRALRFDDWMGLAEQLTAAGKEVVLSSLALVEAESELASLRRIAANGRCMVEANDTAMVAIAADAGVPFVAGPHLNIYNGATLDWLVGLGARRWVLPVELSRDTLARMQQTRPAGVETEVFVYGRLPLAFSARCFSARTRGRAKDDCGLCCGDDPEGRLMRTREGAAFLTINGIQTQSASVANLIAEVPQMRELGVDLLRISPQSPQAVACAVAAFRAAIDGAPDVPLTPPEDGDWCNGYWYGQPGMQWHAFGDGRLTHS